MYFRNTLSLCLLVVFGLGTFSTPEAVRAAPTEQVSAFELILAMNTLRVAYGLPPLIEDPIVNAVAQNTAATMAANNMSWHIGDVRGRIAAAGYGAGGTVWATENFAVGDMGIDEIMAVWADPDHMRPAVTPAYCHVGAGTAQTSDGRTYYILQAAYVSGQECGSITSSASGTIPAGGVPNPGYGLIQPVKIATPDADGKVYHEVQFGQSFWSIAIAYQITINDLETWNNLSRDTPLSTGQRLFIPGKNTAGYATPTPFGMIVPAAPAPDGRIVHEVAAYQTLSTISDAYKVSLDQILALNGLQIDWPLQIGQQLLISLGDVTPGPTLSAVQKLTPAADGRYYHTIQSGETLSGIAGSYDVPLASLMTWNGLDSASVILAGQKLLLLVTPPPTATLPPTETFTPTATRASATPSLTPAATGTPVPAETGSTGGMGLWMGLGVVLLLAGGFVWWRKKSSSLRASEGGEAIP
jgi:LPXTG-motif cell wall-anchored protein